MRKSLIPFKDLSTESTYHVFDPQFSRNHHLIGTFDAYPTIPLLKLRRIRTGNKKELLIATNDIDIENAIEELRQRRDIIDSAICGLAGC